MLDENPSLSGSASRDDSFAVLEDLERNTPEQIRRQRAHFRLTVKAPVILQPGSASQLTNLKVKGATGDISEGGCSALFPVPVQVGDVYRMQFDRKVLDLPLTFARCVRCRLVREDAFEAGFAFFTPVSLPEQVAEPPTSLIS